MREHILSEIRRLALLNGQAPGAAVFERETGIGSHGWRGKFWARWGDALTEAGLAPNEWAKKLDSTEVLRGVIEACRHYGRVPTFAEIGMLRAQGMAVPPPKTVSAHFESKNGLLLALAKLSAGDKNLADIAAMLPSDISEEEPRSKASVTAREGFVYLIKSGEFFKIGRGDDLERRVKQIKVALPDKAELIHSIRTDDPPGIEAYWHRRFDEKRANGEWFKLSALDVSAFKKRKFQ